LADWLKAFAVTNVAGGHRRVLAAGLAHPRRRLRADARQRPARQAGPGPQDRRV
jgi:hypothetical protein